MKSHSFTTDDARDYINNDQEQQKRLNSIAQIVPSNTKIIGEATIDIYIEDADGKIVSLKTELKKKNIEYTPAAGIDELNKTYNLSEDQAKYVINSAVADKIAGAIAAFSEVEMAIIIKPEMTNNFQGFTRRSSPMTKLTIANDGTATLTGGNKTLYDCPEGSNGNYLNRYPKLTNDFTSQDYMTVNMTVDLGKIGMKFDKAASAINIDVTGNGPIAEAIINDIKNITHDRTIKQRQNIEDGYTRFSKPLYEFLGKNKVQQENVKETVKALVNSKTNEDLDRAEDFEFLKKLSSTPQIIAEFLVEQVEETLDRKSSNIDAVTIKTNEDLQKLFPLKTLEVLKKVTETIVKGIEKARDNPIYRKERDDIIFRLKKTLKKFFGIKDKLSIENTKDEDFKKLVKEAQETAHGLLGTTKGTNKETPFKPEKQRERAMTI